MSSIDPTPQLKDVQNANILIVEDLPLNLQMVSKILHRRGFGIMAAMSGEQALESISIQKPDLILLDVSMPGMSGFEVCERLKRSENTKDIPVIFLTGKTEIGDMVKGFKLGAVDYVTKPFSTEVLVSRVLTHLEVKRSRDIIVQQNQQLKELNATKDKFFSIIAHDLKNPFHVLNNLAKMLITNYDRFSDEKRLQFVKTIFDSSDSGFRLLENLLHWARTQTGRIACRPSPIELKDCIKKVIESISVAAKDKGIFITNGVAEDVTVVSDKNMLETTLRNLIFNAVKFTPPSGEIWITTRETAENPDVVQISVSDTGIGIPPEDMDKLFRMDVHFTTHGTKNEPGTGLGLLLCKEFVEKNHGTIWAESEQNQGSHFKFTVPKFG